MAWATKEEKMIGFIVKGKIGRPMLCGWAMCGWSQCGEDIEFNGTYQMRRSRIGNGIDKPIVFGKAKICKMMPTWPVQPPSVLRDAQQDKFKTALQMWQNLTIEEKKAYNTYACRLSRRGYDYFMSKTLKSL
jgi:hypothetical protein